MHFSLFLGPLQHVLVRASSWLAEGHFLSVRSHGLLSVPVLGEREPSLSLLVRPPVLSDQEPVFMISLNLNYLLKSHLQIHPLWGLELKHTHL